MSVNPLEDLKYGRRTLNVARFREVDHDLYMAKIKNVTGESLDEMAPEIGQLDYRAVDENGKLRMIMSAINLLADFGISAHFAGFKEDGVSPSFWADADYGALAALGGNLLVDGDGLSIFGLVLAQYFEATNGSETRRFYIGMTLPQDETVPVLTMQYTGPEATNLATNGDFEDGDLTGWTDANSAWEVIDSSPYEGTYAAKHDGTLGIYGGNLVKDTAAVSPGDVVLIGFAHKREVGILAGKLKIEWLTAGSAVISTDYIYGTTGSSWTSYLQNFVAPATAASVRCTFVPGDPFNIEHIDALSITVTDTLVELRFTDAGLKYFYNGSEVNLFPEYKQAAVLWTAEMIASVTTAITRDALQYHNLYVGPTAGNANDLDEFTWHFTIKSGSTYSINLLGITATNCGKTDLYIDGVSVATAIDWYSGSTTNNVEKTASGITLTEGAHILKVKVNGKHASSTDYRFLITQITIKPSAYS